ncbi:hypothetical protein JOF41_002461 [Saccharothrix coeruleofusca]|uniref:helix-turn-helix domain-containing protein n=1 Tax=Saccharothrix coeruleofusca TaxID=33919 RepID=UPI001AE5D7BA|nr:helix-turn-helix transcriptional regulator [Saccharothrix coeruleofusca]MBP2336283.1 hypothetical protein [Saccharothrix coeruleofusca]
MVGTSPKAVALGAQLRAVREARDIGLRAFAKRAGTDHSTLSRVESGERPPTPEQVATYVRLLGVDGAERDRLVEMARDTDGAPWLAISLPERQAQLSALLTFEQLADRIVTVEPLLVPGLLQTSSYIRAVMRSGDVPTDEVELRVAIRLGRQEVLSRERNPVRYTAFIGASALRHTIGGPSVMVDQLRHLLKVAEWPNVTLHVIPDDVGWHPGLEGGFVIVGLEAAMNVVHIENRRSGLFLRDKEDIAVYQDAVEKVLEVALTPDRTIEFIIRIAEKIEGTR